MREFAILFVHLIVTLARLARPGGLRSVVAESVLVRHQLLILRRCRKRAPNLHATDRFVAGLCTLFMRRTRILRSAIGLRPSTLLHLHDVLKKRKYRMLFFAFLCASTRPQGIEPRTHRRRRRNETAESSLGLSMNMPFSTARAMTCARYGSNLFSSRIPDSLLM